MFGPVIEGTRIRLEPPRPEYYVWLAEIHRDDWERAEGAACTVP